MAEKNLTFKLVMDADVKNYVSNVKQSEATTKAVFATIKAEADKFRGASDAAAQGLNALSNEARSTAQHVSVLDQAIGQTNAELAQTRTAAAQVQTGIAGLRTGLTSLASALAAVGVGLTAQQLAQTVDTYTNLSTQVRLATEDNGNFEQAMAGVHLVALATNSSLDATAMLFARVNDAGKEMGYTQQQTLQLTKTITQAIQAGGGSAQAAEDALQQFIQALQGGVLRGEEFNSVMEGAPGLAKALAQSFNVTTGELRKMAENGELTSDRVLKAVESMSGKVQATYDKMPMTIGNALQRIQTQWQILIGTMDQSNGASSTVAQWLSTLADNMDVVEQLLADIGSGFVWVGDQLKKIDPATIQELKNVLGTVYETVKSVGSAAGITFTAFADLLNTALSQTLGFSSGVDAAGDKTNGFTKFLQVLNVALGFLVDGFNGIGIGINLFVGALYSAGSAWEGLKARFTWGEVKAEALTNMAAMQAKAEEYYQKASDGALNFESQGKKAWEEIGKTQDQKNAESLQKNKSALDELTRQEQAHTASYKSISDERVKLEQQLYEARRTGNQASIDLAIKGLADLDAKEKAYQAESQKITQDKIEAAQAIADATIKSADAAGMAQLKAFNAKLAAQGLQAEFDATGKVIVKAMADGATSIDGTTVAINKAKAGATTLGLDIDVALNRVSKNFEEKKGSLDNFTNGLETMGVTGQQAADLTYQGWLKWLETAKSQAEIDYAKKKLKEFGDQGEISTKQVEMGLVAIDQQANKLPDSIDPVTEAFKRLGIETKENLKMAAKQALMDYITVRDSGKATAEGIQKAHEKAAQAVALSGDAAVTASFNAASAGRDLRVEIDDTGVASVKSMDKIEQAMYRVRNSTRDAEQGFRDLGRAAREEAKDSITAWNDVMEAQGEAERKNRGNSRTGVAVRSITKAQIEQELRNMGYSEQDAKQKASSIYNEGINADKSTMQKNTAYGEAGRWTNKMFQDLHDAGKTATQGTIAIEKLLAQAASNVSPNVNEFAPASPRAAAAPFDVSRSPDKNVNIQFSNGDQTAQVSATGEDADVLEQMLRELEILKKAR